MARERKMAHSRHQDQKKASPLNPNSLNTYARALPYFTLGPRQKMASTDVFEFPKTVTLLSGYLWVGYDQNAIFEAGCRVWLRPKYPTTQGYSGNVLLGGVYLHKHTAWNAYQNDFYPLMQLHDIQPLTIAVGSQIIVDRDIFNINPTESFNAWDVELIVVVAE